jgi:hypothetical protein
VLIHWFFDAFVDLLFSNELMSCNSSLQCVTKKWKSGLDSPHDEVCLLTATSIQSIGAFIVKVRELGCLPEAKAAVTRRSPITPIQTCG